MASVFSNKAIYLFDEKIFTASVFSKSNIYLFDKSMF